MEQLEIIKGKSVVIPKVVNRYIVMYYDKYGGWKCNYHVYTNPETAIQEFLEQSKFPHPSILYYKVVEVELEIPFVAKG